MAAPVDKKALQAEVEAAVIAELKRVGPEELNKAELARRFEGRGPSRATLYRWIDGPLKSGAAGQELVREVKAAAQERAKAPDPPKAAVQAAAPRLPAVVTVDDVASSGVIPVIERLTTCIGVADQVITYARNADGTVRSAKILLAASEHMRRSLETAAKLQQAIAATARVDEFHGAVLELLEGVARDHPEAAEAIISRLGQLSARWGGLE